MTFWSNAVEPTRQFRFKVIVGGDTWWWVKSINKPSFTISSNARTVAGTQYVYPDGAVEWNNITMVMVDTGGQTRKIYDILRDMGWGPPESGAPGVSKRSTKDAIGDGIMEIHQLNSQGEVIEKWKLHNPWLYYVNFGDLNYASDELVSVEVSIAYDFATMEDI